MYMYIVSVTTSRKPVKFSEAGRVLLITTCANLELCFSMALMVTDLVCPLWAFNTFKLSGYIRAASQTGKPAQS